MNAEIGEVTTPAPATVAVFPRIHAWETLLLAWDRVEENEGGPGVDGVTLDDFELRLDEELQALGRDLRDHVHRPQPLLRALMPKPSGGTRVLAIPTVRDRVAQSAAAIVITPILEREFEAASFGFRKRRSVPHAVAQVRRYYDEGYRWVVDADIDNFFDEVEHERLLGRLRESIPDEEFLALVRAWLTAPLKDGARLIERARGLPQGGPISPVLANLYLDRFDEALLARRIRLVRFADDFIILCKERPQAEAALEITEGLLRDLQLSLDAGKTQVTNFDRGFRYLGHLFLRSMVIPSPNRLQRREGLTSPAATIGTSANVAGAPPIPPDSAAETVTPAQTITPAMTPAKTPRAVRAVSPPADDTPMARALADALHAAGRESLVLQESPSPPPPAPAAPSPEISAEPDASSPLSEAAPTDVAPRPTRAVGPFRRTLYIQEQGTILARQGERLLVKKDDAVLLEVPAAKVDQIFVFGRCAITTPAMIFCLEEEIPVVLLSSRGRYYGLLDSPVGDRVSLHRQQFAGIETLLVDEHVRDRLLEHGEMNVPDERGLKR